METLQGTLQIMMAWNYLSDIMQEQKRTLSSETGQQQREGQTILRSRKRVLGKGLMALGMHLSKMGKSLEGCV